MGGGGGAVRFQTLCPEAKKYEGFIRRESGRQPGLTFTPVANLESSVTPVTACLWTVGLSIADSGRTSKLLTERKWHQQACQKPGQWQKSGYRRHQRTHLELKASISQLTEKSGNKFTNHIFSF